jgi:CRISPR-associated endonuclease Csn1
LAINKLPIINKTQDECKFLFSIKINEYFIFPNEDFDPNSIDLLDEINYSKISENLFRVQSISQVKYGNSIVRSYDFRHHLETQLRKELVFKGLLYKQIKSLNDLKGVVKVRLNHLGEIVKVGEY